MSDIWARLQSRKRSGPGLPLVTFVDAARDERVELSATSLENAAAKIANALRDEYDLVPGETVAVDLPVHWQRAAWCAGIWTAGCILTTGGEAGASGARLHVTSADRAAELASRGREPIAVVSLHPFGLPVAATLPPQAHDATLVVRLQPDAYLYEPPSDDLPAWQHAGHDVLTQAELLHVAGERGEQWGVAQGGRLLAGAGLDEADAWLAALAVPLATGCSVVLVTGDYDVADMTRAEGITATASRQR